MIWTCEYVLIWNYSQIWTVSQRSPDTGEKPLTKEEIGDKTGSINKLYYPRRLKRPLKVEKEKKFREKKIKLKFLKLIKK